WDITDANSVGVIESVSIAGGIAAVVPATASSRKLFVSNTTHSTSLRKVSFRSIDPSLHNYLIISNRALMKPAMGYGDVVQAYGGYRASTAGGGYDTLTVSV